jgi:hypothetical protein
MRIAVLLLITCCFISYAQENKGKLTGKVVDKNTGEPLVNANIVILPIEQGTISDNRGIFSIQLPFGKYVMKLSYIGYESISKSFTLSGNNPQLNINIELVPRPLSQKEVSVTGKKEIFSPVTQSLQKVDIERMPTVYSDVLRSVKILAGVNSNDELTSAYNVRGGNYNENLIYLDGYEIYRPFLVTEGIEENQSIINGDMVSSLNFNGGTFGARLGDKMSSALEITYKDNFDTSYSGTLRTGLLNSGAAISKRFGNLNLAGAVRYSYPKLFASTMQTEGSYNPTYFDVQLLGNYKLTSTSDLELLFINANNKFNLTPANWAGNFQTAFLDVKEVLLEYNGSHNYTYNTGLIGLRYNKKVDDNINFSIDGSEYSTREDDYKNLTSNVYYSDDAYDVANNKQYLKTQYDYANDKLTMNAYELKSSVVLKSSIHSLESGISFHYYKFNNIVDESYNETGVDSVLDAPYSTNIIQNVKFPAYSGYIQDNINFNKTIQAEAGVRVLRYNFSNETLISPRASINYFFNTSSSVNLSGGYYYQPPFYYEVMNKIVDNSKTSLKSQRSINFMAAWQTKFDDGAKFTADIYYKKLDRLIPYYVDQLKLVYGDSNNYNGYARGFDLQYEGELVKGIKTWIGYGYLDTRERMGGSSAAFIPRLLDQTHTLKIFLQDRVKNRPNFQSHVTLLFGSGYLYHPYVSVKDPATNKYYMQIDYNDSWLIPFYFRVDMGLSYKFELKDNRDITVTVDVLNIFNKNNIASYSWYHVFPETTQPVGVPQMFSPRFLSVEAEMNF